MTTFRASAVSLLLALGLVAALAADPPGVAASHLGEGVPDETSVTVSFVASGHEQIPDRIAARLVSYDGTPIGLADVEFLREIEFLGPRRVLLGRAVTDASGTAQVPIAAVHEPLRIEVRFAGKDQHAPASTVVDVAVPPGSGESQANRFEPPRPQVSLGPLAAVMPPLISVGVFGVWVGLVLLTVVTLLGISRGHRTGVPGRNGGETETNAQTGEPGQS